MKVEVLSDQPVSRNLASQRTGVACSYPQATILENGDIACLYRQGATKHSYDGVLVLQTSSDRGASWSDPAIAFDGRSLRPPQSVVSGGVCQAPSCELLVTFGLVDASHPDVYAFSEEGLTFERQICASRSADGGQTWSPPAVIDTSPYPLAGITAKPFVLPEGKICVPVEISLPSGAQATAAAFSSDGGRTFGPLVTFAADHSGQRSLCDAHFATLASGDLLMLLWTFLQEGERTIDVHQSISSDRGRTWSAPQGTGIQGQVTVPLELSSGAVIAVSNHREPPQGIQLWASDGGGTWDSDHPVQMWDVRGSCVLGQPTVNAPPPADEGGIWEALQAFTFGTPDLVALADGSIVMVYYATLEDVIHVRACRFRLSELGASSK